MPRRFEEYPVHTVASANEAIDRDRTGESTAWVILGVALHDPDRVAAEGFCRWWARGNWDDASRAGLLGLVHLVQRFGTCDGATWALVQELRGVPTHEEIWQQVADEFARVVREIPVWDKPILVLDGGRIADLNGFYDEVSRSLIPDTYWGRNLDAFNDILQGGFGTPDDGFVLRWTDVKRSREALGLAETARWLSDVLKRCHPSNQPEMTRRLGEARLGRGPSLFEMIVEIIADHGPGGDEHVDMVDLELVG